MDTVALKARVHEDLSASRIPPFSTISFRHPAYADSDDILFELPRLDQTEHGPATGVHYLTALRACQIIANNAFHGYLSIDRDGQQAVTGSPDDVLTGDSYWFIVERRDGDGPVEQRQGRNVYPIVPSFEDWQFPHDDFPSLWWDVGDDDDDGGGGTTTPPGAATAPLHPAHPTRIATFAVPAVPQPNFSRCILSNHGYSVTKAHIVPSANVRWFQINNMKRYEDEHHTRRFIHNIRNTLSLRVDLHTMWDAHMLAFVPKRGQFVAHVLAAPTLGGREFAAEWHNRPVQRGALGVAEQYMFAKFAQAIFMLLKPFVAFSSMGKYVARLRAKAGEMEEYEVRSEWLSLKALHDLYSGGGSRRASESPGSRKRSRSQTSANDWGEEDIWEQPRHKMVRVDLWGDASDEEGYGCEDEKWEQPRRKMVRVNLRADDASDEDECPCCYEGLAGPEEEFDDDDDENGGRGRSRRRSRQRPSRNEHTVDTLPSLTDTSVADTEENYDNKEDEGDHSWPAEAESEGGWLLPAGQSSDSSKKEELD